MRTIFSIVLLYAVVAVSSGIEIGSTQLNTTTYNVTRNEQTQVPGLPKEVCYGELGNSQFVNYNQAVKFYAINGYTKITCIESKGKAAIIAGALGDTTVTVACLEYLGCLIKAYVGGAIRNSLFGGALAMILLVVHKIL